MAQSLAYLASMWTKETAKAASDIAHGKAIGKDGQIKPRRSAVRQPSRRKQVSAIQNVLHDCVMTLQADLHSCEEPEVRARVAMAISSSAKGWQSANAQERQLKGEPNVKPVDAPKPDTKTRKPAIPLGPA